MRYTTPPGQVLTACPVVNDDTDIFDGAMIADFITRGGPPCYHINTMITPFSVVYSFNLNNIFDYNKNRLNRILEAFNRRYKTTAALTDTAAGDINITIPKHYRRVIYISELINTTAFNQSTQTTAVLGLSTDNRLTAIDIAQAPHILIAGATGAGKSVLLNTMINSLLFKTTPVTGRFIMIDPKRVELSIYDGLPHLKQPVITDMKQAVEVLYKTVREMDHRYQIMQAQGVNDVSLLPFIPRLYVVIDELADLMITAGPLVEKSIIRIAQLGRAAGIHLIIATQRPDKSVVTGLIKANIPTKIALTTANQYDSRVILNHAGAEKLTGNGHGILKYSKSMEEQEFIAALTPADDIQRVKQWYIDQQFNQMSKLDRLIYKLKQ